MAPYSIIVPCRNVAPWLERCFSGIFAAAAPDAEIIAVDDGSTDETPRLLAAMPRVRTIRQAHRGVSAARNRALDVAGGRLVFFVDPDDEVEKDFFSSMCEAMERDAADYCVCAFRTVDDATGETREYMPRLDYRFKTNAQILEGYLPRIFGYSMQDVREWTAGRALFANREMAQVWRAAFRREIIEREAIRFDESVELCEDMVFNSRYLLSARSMTCVPRILYISRARADGATASIPRDARRLARNKLALLRARNALDAKAGGALAPLYAGTCVFGALEILWRAARNPGSARCCLGVLRRYLADAAVRRALPQFPLSPRKPATAAAVVLLALLSRFSNAGR